VLARLRAGHSPDQVADRLRREHGGAHAERLAATVSHEAIYTWLYALLKGDLVIGKAGRSAMATLARAHQPLPRPGRPARRATRRDATTTCHALIDSVGGMPEALVKTLTWDQGAELAGHAAALTLATKLDVYFAHLDWAGQRHYYPQSGVVGVFKDVGVLVRRTHCVRECSAPWGAGLQPRSFCRRVRSAGS